jgi:RNA-binding protein PNO1
MDYEDTGMEEPASPQHLDLSAASTTIDASVVQSRIRQSASVQKENATMMEEGNQPVFPKLSAAQASGNKIEYRRVRCPPHRYTPLREHWEQILTPLVEYLKLQVSAFFRSTMIQK